MTQSLVSAPQTLTPVSPWTIWGGTFSPIMCWKEPSGMVNVRGLVVCASGLTTSQQIALLPLGFRPLYEEPFTMSGNMDTGGATIRVDVMPDGRIMYIIALSYTGSPTTVTYMTLSGIRFLAGV